MTIRAIVLSLFFLIVSPVQSGDLRNQLVDHPAPYLALHGSDPVAWQTWNEDAMALANQQNKIIYLSIGYFACHWCHVMQQESYKNNDIAEFLNENFIPVKIDRELEPALDQQLMDFTQRILGRGGWPLNVFITPTGYPVYSVLYTPPDQFLEILNRLHTVWIEDSDQVTELVSRDFTRSFPAANSSLNRVGLARIIADSTTGILQRADLENGGFGTQHKFPSVPQLSYLLYRYQSAPDDTLKNFLELTLTTMASQGLQDHLTGGFFRYTTDPRWAIPHFEKMLYDNANLARLYLEAARILQHPQFKEISYTTLRFMEQHMWHERGAFISSFSAVDDRNIEGGSYLWTAEQIRHTLDEQQAHLILNVWNLDRPPELPAGNHARFSMSLDQYAVENNIKSEEVDRLFEQAKSSLTESRQERALPADDKLLAGWNGLALSTFVAAGKHFPGSGFEETARALRDFLVMQLWDGKSLSRAMAKGSLLGAASLEDYAFVSRGLLDWAQFSSSDNDYRLAMEISRQGWERFYRGNGWYQGDNSLLAPGVAEEILADGAIPAPSAVLISTSLALAEKYSNTEMSNRSLSALNRSERLLTEAPFWYVSQLQAVSLALDSQLPSQE
jgi:uncharacterized protein YyaL (SSP411 family)